MARCVRTALVGAALGILLGSATAPPARAQTVHYRLLPESRIVVECGKEVTCALPGEETLEGGFDLTLLSVPAAGAMEAVTGVDWRSPSYRIRGTGFLQRLGAEGVTMVVEGRVNGAPVLLTTGSRQPASAGDLRLLLVTPPRTTPRYAVWLVARPEATDAPDGDGDGVPDAIDNCPAVFNAGQEDQDGDGVGDGCDRCADTDPAEPVLGDGCAPEQECACGGPTPETEWPSQRAYVRCVARALRELRRAGKLTRREVRRLLRDAVRSGCGRRIVALR